MPCWDNGDTQAALRTVERATKTNLGGPGAGGAVSGKLTLGSASSLINSITAMLDSRFGDGSQKWFYDPGMGDATWACYLAACGHRVFGEEKYPLRMGLALGNIDTLLSMGAIEPGKVFPILGDFTKCPMPNVGDHFAVASYLQGVPPGTYS